MTSKLLDDLSQETKKGLHKLRVINYLLQHKTATMTDITEVNTQMLTTGVIKGMLNPVLEFNVNYVNAPSLAKERSIKVREVKHKESQDFQNLIAVCVIRDSSILLCPSDSRWGLGECDAVHLC